MSKTHPHKKILIYGVMICFAVLMIATGCSTQQKKRGIVFRGDWAFEINRTPWVGHPGNTDLPGQENGENSENRQKKSLCTRDKKTSLTDALLGPLTSFKSKCRCKDCLASGANGANINYTSYSYNPSIANSFPNPLTGAYPGSIPQGSLSLPSGAIVVPTGVLMPNGTLLPHHVFYSQPNATGHPGINPATGQALPQTLPLPEPGTPQGQLPAVATPQGTPVQPPQLQTPQLQVPQVQAVPSFQAPATSVPAPAVPAFGGVVTPQAVTPEMQNAMMQNALLQSLNASNAMMVNPAQAQVVPGLSMTGTQAPGYPPIGYAPSGYAPGYAQQMNAPPIVGPMGANAMQQPPLTAGGGSQGKASGTAVAEEEDEEPELPRQVASMPYPRHHPVPTRPVYQRNTGMAPDYAAVRPPMPSMMPNPGMSPQAQISHAAVLQEQQMLLERQRQALLMQQNMSAQSTSRQPVKSNFLRRPPTVAEDEEETAVPKTPLSNILLANHQTSILQPPPPRVSQVTQASESTATKKTR